MPPVFSTPAGATVTYLSSTWPLSLHASSRNMTFWNDLLSALAQFSLFSSSTVATPSTISEVGHFVSTAAVSTTTIPPSFHEAFKSPGNARDHLKQSIIQPTHRYDDFLSRVITKNSDLSDRNVSAAMSNDVKMLNLSNVPPSSLSMNETLTNGTSHYNNFTTDSVLSSLVDCNDFTEQKLLNIVICSITDVNSNNLINGSSAVDNSTYNDTLRNVSDDLFRIYNFNNSYNGTEIAGNDSTSSFKASQFESTIYFIQVVTTAVVLGIIILATVIGNVFVIAAILLEKNLQSVANYLILSLAVADLLVACLVMPLSAVYEISREWKLGPELCDMWTSSDVLCCTASILHLVAIALDRFWAVTNIDYAHQRTGQRIGIMIVILWILSFLVSIAPMLGWKDPEWDKRLENYECLVSQDIYYQIFATASSFYVPLLAILFLYWRIFLVARKRIRRRQQANVQTSDKPRKANASICNIPLTSKPTFGIRWKVSYGQQQQQQQKKQMPTIPSGGCTIAQAAGGSGTIAAAVVAVIGRPLPTISEATTTTTTTAFTNVSSANTSPEKCSYDNGLDDRIEVDGPTDNVSVAYPSNVSCPPHPIPLSWKKPPNSAKDLSKCKPSILKKKTPTVNDTSSKRERKAAKTLAIITGAFVVCWMPFFVIAVLLPVCADECQISPIIISLFLWLGYFNSTLNPILYTIFNQDFRHAFMKILCGRRNSARRRNRRMGLRETR